MIAASSVQRTRLVGSVDTVIVGAGQNGLAMSHCLEAQSIDHVILERGEVANTWSTERWDSLRLLTPNWQCQFPGYQYDGDDPEGFMTVNDFIPLLRGYASRFNAPVHEGTCVLAVSAVEGGYSVETNRGRWMCKTLVIASGAFNTPIVPDLGGNFAKGVDVLTSHQYKNPTQLAEGGVLVVGASATGIQFADEIQRSGREVTLSVGEHVRLPRRYRDRDILWWMDRCGLLDEGYQEVDDIGRARRVPSMQLLGTESGRILDINGLQQSGVTIVGRLAGVHDQKLQFSGSLGNVCKLADLKMHRLLRGIDEWIHRSGVTAGPVQSIDNTVVEPQSKLGLDLRKGEVKTVIWACGYRPDYTWLNVPVLDGRGNIRHDGGVVAAPGMYVMGLPFMRKRKSSFIYGASDDALYLSGHLADYVRNDKQGRRFAKAV